MKILNDADVRHYIKNGLIGLILFVGAALFLLFYFRTGYEIELSKSTFEYKENVDVSSVVKSIGDEVIHNDDRISTNTIKLDEYEVTLDEIDTTKLGEQTITAKFSDESIKDEILTVTVKDTKKPKIKWLVDEGTKIKLKDVKKKNFDGIYVVSDNYTATSHINVETYIEEDDFGYGDTITLHVKATDSNNNTRSKSIQLQIEDKPVKENEDADDEDEDKSTDSTKNESVSQQTQSSTYNQSSSQTTTQQSTSNQSTSASKPSNKVFSFEDGYDMSNVTSACMAELTNSGYSGSCNPITDSDGIYTGMELIYD